MVYSMVRAACEGHVVMLSRLIGGNLCRNKRRFLSPSAQSLVNNKVWFVS